MQSLASIPPLYEVDLDTLSFIDSFPEDFECFSCMMIKTDILTCRSCSATCCQACLYGFAHSAGKKIPNGQYECTVCHKVDTFLPQNKILADILQNFKFECKGPCG